MKPMESLQPQKLSDFTGQDYHNDLVVISSSDLKDLYAEVYSTRAALMSAYQMLAESLDSQLMLSTKLTNAQKRWLGRDEVQ